MSGGSPQRPRPAELGSQGVMSSKKAHTESRLRFITFTPAPAPGAIPLSGELGNQCVRRRLQSVRAAVARCHSCTMQFLSLSPLSFELPSSVAARTCETHCPPEGTKGGSERTTERKPPRPRRTPSEKRLPSLSVPPAVSSTHGCAGASQEETTEYGREMRIKKSGFFFRFLTTNGPG